MLGARIVNGTGRMIVSSVTRGYGAWDGGLNVDDEIIAANGNRLYSGDELDRIVENLKSGDQLQLLISRDGRLQPLNITLTNGNVKSYVIMPLQEISSEQMTIQIEKA